jgi:hypothetical protein
VGGARAFADVEVSLGNELVGHLEVVFVVVGGICVLRCQYLAEEG